MWPTSRTVGIKLIILPPTKLTGFSLGLSGMQAQLSVVYTEGVGDACGRL